MITAKDLVCVSTNNFDSDYDTYIKDSLYKFTYIITVSLFFGDVLHNINFQIRMLMIAKNSIQTHTHNNNIIIGV